MNALRMTKKDEKVNNKLTSFNVKKMVTRKFAN